VRRRLSICAIFGVKLCVSFDGLIGCTGELLQATVPCGFKINYKPIPLLEFNDACRKTTAPVARCSLSPLDKWSRTVIDLRNGPAFS
jgi:hypothetical protein